MTSGTQSKEKAAVLDFLTAARREMDRLLAGNELDMRLHHVADAFLSRKLAETDKVLIAHCRPESTW